MFKKLIQNHQTFNDQLLRFFDKLDEGLSTVDIDKAGEFLVFNRSYEYIQKVDPDNLVAQEALFRFADIHLTIIIFTIINRDTHISHTISHSPYHSQHLSTLFTPLSPFYSLYSKPYILYLYIHIYIFTHTQPSVTYIITLLITYI